MIMDAFLLLASSVTGHEGGFFCFEKGENEMRRTLRSALSMVMIVLMVVMLMTPAFAEKGGKKPPGNNEDPVSIISLDGSTQIESEIEVNKSFEFILNLSNTGNYSWDSTSMGTLSYVIEATQSDNLFVYTAGVTEGIDNVEIQLYDTSKRKAKLVETFSFDVTVVSTTENIAPVLDFVEDFTVEESQTHEIVVTATDTLGDTLSYSIIESQSNATIDNDGNLSYTSTTTGNDSFTVMVTDGELSDTQIVYVTVTEKNTAPVFVDKDGYSVESYDLSLEEDASIILNTFVEDQLGDTFNYDVSVNPANGTVIDNEDGTFIYEPTENYNGEDSFYVTVQDEGGLENEIRVNVIISAVNDEPEMEIIGTVETTVNSTLVFAIDSWDVDGDSITYGISANPYASIDEFGNFDFTTDSVGIYTVDITVTSGTDVITQTITIIVTEDQLIYVALGDSIPSGVSGSGFVGTDYTERISGLLGTEENETYVNRSVSGFNAVDVYDILNGRYSVEYNETGMLHDVESWVTNADVITLCVGANDIMDAAPRTGFFGSLDKYDIQWPIADTGRSNFETYWHQIINRIEELNPDVTLITMTIYNPYRTTDSYYKLVDPYFTSADDSKYGLNYIIKETENLYSQELEPDFDYRFVDIYTEFNNHLNKDSLTGFYNKIFGIDVCDPHPNQNGHDFIYLKHELILQ